MRTLVQRKLMKNEDTLVQRKLMRIHWFRGS